MVFGVFKRWFAGIFVGQGQTHYDKDELSYARAQFQRALRIAPDHYQARVMLGATLRREKKYTEAVEELSVAIEAKPKQDAAWRGRGLAKIELSDYAGAIEDCHQALELKKNYRNYLALGSAYTRAGRFDEAEKTLLEAKQLEPHDALVAERLGDCFYAQNRLSDAQRAYRDSTRSDSRDSKTFAKLAEVTEKMGDYKEAAVLYTRAGFLEPSNAQYRCDAARVAIAAGDVSGAVFAYQEAVKLDPDCLEALCALGSNALELGDFEKARSYAERAIGAQPDSDEAKNLMSKVNSAEK